MAQPSLVVMSSITPDLLWHDAPPLQVPERFVRAGRPGHIAGGHRTHHWVSVAAAAWYAHVACPDQSVSV